MDMTEENRQKLISPTNLDDATKILTNLGSQAQILAGGTWIMRAHVRGEFNDKVFVSLGNIEALHNVSLDNDSFRVGAMVTHHRIAVALKEASDLTGLMQAASVSANPAVRRMATVGGNVCSRDFSSPDLLPVLIASEATLFLKSNAGNAELSIEEYLKTRSSRPSGELLISIHVPRGSFRSSHQRILMRQAGEYPVANLSMRYEVNTAGLLENVRIAVGSVEDIPRRWSQLEQGMTGKAPSELNITKLAQEHIQEFTGRDGPDAPGWYRTRILPRLASDAFDASSQQKH